MEGIGQWTSEDAVRPILKLKAAFISDVYVKIAMKTSIFKTLDTDELFRFSANKWVNFASADTR